MILIAHNSEFDLGQIVATAGAMDAFTEEQLQDALNKFASGDWGNVPGEDQLMNDEAIASSRRPSLLMGEYVINGKRLWCHYNPGITTILLPSEY
jgi:hypothetical protein